MTWRHVAVIALAVVLVLGCGVSHVCVGTPEAINHVTQIATAMVSGTLGHAGAHMHMQAVRAASGGGSADVERTT